jgi:hypothetical protein
MKPIFPASVSTELGKYPDHASEARETPVRQINRTLARGPQALSLLNADLAAGETFTTPTHRNGVSK